MSEEELKKASGIVSTETFAAAQAQLTRNRAQSVGRPGSRFYLLRGLARCGLCRRPMHGVPSHGRRYYRCAGRDRLGDGERCRAGAQAAEPLEALVWETVESIVRNPAVLAERMEAYRARLGVREIEVLSEVEHLRRQLAAVRAQEQKLLDLYLVGSAPLPSVAERLQGLAEARETAEARIAQSEGRVVRQRAVSEQRETLERFCAAAARGLEVLNDEGRRDLLRSLVDEVSVTGDVLELRGVLPAVNRPDTQQIRDDSQHVGYVLVVPRC
jgi:hypothetical protein